MADISKLLLPGEAEARNLKDAAVRERVSALENAESGPTQYTATLAKANWTSSTVDDVTTYTQVLSLPALTCGSKGNISPIISWTSNYTDYSNLDTATATAGVGITFTTKVQVSDDIGILIIDMN